MKVYLAMIIGRLGRIGCRSRQLKDYSQWVEV
jgi:hypothetical protein